MGPNVRVALEEEADFGRLPFDVFLSDRWDINITGDSQEQWERFVEEWEGLTLLERYPYQQRPQSESDPPELSEEIKRVLATHQTAHERNISPVSCASCQTILFRLCYDLDLAENNEQIKRKSEVSGADKILDNSSRYDFDDGSGESWRRVLIRMPGITDFSCGFDMDGDGSQ